MPGLLRKCAVCFLIPLLLWMLPITLYSQSLQQEEVLLTFRHPAVGHVYVNSLYDNNNGQSFLPLIELFSLLEINYNSDSKNLTVTGNFIKPGNPYSINLSALQVSVGKEIFPITTEDFRIDELDYFISPSVFEKVFGLNFTVNMMHLVLSLETTHTLPVQERKEREKARGRMEDRQELRENFPMGYNRKRSVISGAMIDYALTGNFTEQNQSMGYTFTGGMELLGGDLQGSLIGYNNNFGQRDLRASSLRWRYVVRDNNLFSDFTVGQISTTGLQTVSIKGLAITNNPVEPRRMYETYVIDGTTEPESEVEIYINERLTDYKRADELGYYRFDVPVTYGSTRIVLRVYTPSGEIKIIDRQMQVPFTFLPKGTVTYNLQAGLADQAWADSIDDIYVTNGNVAVGVSRWLTASVGTQHIGREFEPENLFYYGSLSARIAKQYLINVDAAPDAFYRINGSVMYASNLSYNFIYTRFNSEGIFNARGAKEEISANVYVPFSIFGLSTGLRFGGEHIVMESNSNTRYRADFNGRLGPVNLRLNYRDNFIIAEGLRIFGEGQFTTALTYTISRSPGVPVYVRGMFIRGQAQYDVRRNVLQNTELQLSKTVFKTARINLNAMYNHLNKALNMQLGFTFDLSQVRSVTTVNSNSGYLSARQSFTGSIGIDAPNRFIGLSNRQQVGRSAASIVQFIDNNNSGHYDADDELLPYRGATLDRTGIMQIGRDSILRISQLQNYYLYNLTVNRNAIADPTLVPMKNEFSFIADPNQHKRIEIPYYRGGIAEGTVLIERDGQQNGQGGLRIFLKGTDNGYEQTIRTFSDGGFYTMDIPPGKYSLEVDPAQLDFLHAVQSEPLIIEIKALSEGDYIEGLIILIVSE